MFTSDGVRAPTRPCNWRAFEPGLSPHRLLDAVDLNLQCEQHVTVCSSYTRVGAHITFTVCVHIIAKVFDVIEKTYVKEETKRDCSSSHYDHEHLWN